MPFFDAHTHLHDSRIVGHIDQIVDRARKAGVSYMITCATMEENFSQTRWLSQQYPDILPCFGIHPWFIDSLTPRWKEQLETHLLSTRSGVGEIGLDFADKLADRDRQIEVFQHQFALAMEMGRPVNIHIRKAWDTFIHILKQFGKLKAPGLIHSYSGSADMIPIFEKYGLFISFSGSVTNPNAIKVLNSLKAVSRNCFVLETDTPDIQPYFDEKRLEGLNEPANLPSIAKIAATRLGQDDKKFAVQAFDNSLNLFEMMLPQNGSKESA